MQTTQNCLRKIGWTIGAVALATVTACGGEPVAGATPGGYAGVDAASPSQAATPDATPRLGPPYPIVLAHGFFGYNKFAGLDFATYFYQVKADLAAHGETMVFTPEVDPFNNSTVRGQQLLAAVEQIIAETGYAKVNIIGHSQGGLDARVVADLRPDLVASVTTIGTPHGGTPVADIAVGLVANNAAGTIIDALAKLIGAPLYDKLGNQSSVVKGLKQCSTQGAAAFNAEYPDAPGVRYFSIAGRTDYAGGGDACKTNEPAFIARWDGDRDGVDPLLSATSVVLTAEDGANDGLVPVKDAVHGQFLGCIPADHLDEIGQLFGDKPSLFNSFDYKQFYEGLVAYLRAQGL